MSLFFVTIGATNRWPLFRPCSVWERNGHLPLTAVFEARWTWLKLPIIANTTYCGLLKQPYKHEPSNNFIRRGPLLRPSRIDDDAQRANRHKSNAKPKNRVAERHADLR